jgi:hypothetical protein
LFNNFILDTDASSNFFFSSVDILNIEQQQQSGMENESDETQKQQVSVFIFRCLERQFL